jgi:hypothetical protein
MFISNERIEEFRRIYKEIYEEEIMEGKARLMALRLLALYGIIARPLPSASDLTGEPAQNADAAS